MRQLSVPVADTQSAWDDRCMEIFKPLRSSWVVLAILCAPIAAFGMADVMLSPNQWFWGVLCILGAFAVVCFNASARLVIMDETIDLRRYGRTVWSIPRAGTEIRDGFAGDVKIIPAHVLWHDGRKAGYLLKSWFDAATIDALRAAVAR